VQLRDEAASEIDSAALREALDLVLSRKAEDS